MQLELPLNPRINDDVRIGLAVQYYDQIQSGLIQLYKTTRAGVTTAICAESINRKERFTAIVPTHAISSETIECDAVKYSDNPRANIIPLLPNKECEKNQKMLESYPLVIG